MKGRLLKKEDVALCGSEVRPLYVTTPAAPLAIAALARPTAPAPEPVAERHTRLLNRVVGKFVRERERLLDELRPELLQLALALAREIVGHEISADPTVIEHTLREALAQLHFASRVIVRLHPDDLAHLREVPEVRDWSAAEVELIADPGVERGGCVLESDRGGVEATIATQLRLLGERLAAIPGATVGLGEASGG